MTSAAIDPKPLSKRSRVDWKTSNWGWVHSDSTMRHGLRDTPRTTRPARVYTPGLDAPVHEAALDYVEGRLGDLVASGSVPKSAAARFQRSLAEFVRPAHPLPQVISDEQGELIALWATGRMSLELLVPAAGAAYVRCTDGEGRVTLSGLYPWLPSRRLSAVLSELTSTITEGTPADAAKERLEAETRGVRSGAAVSATIRRINELHRSRDYAELDAQTSLRTIEFVRSVAPDSSVSPTLLPDEDGTAILHWVCGDRSLIVDVDSTGPVLLWAKTGDSQAMASTDPTEITRLARQLVETYTSATNSVNPPRHT